MVIDFGAQNGWGPVSAETARRRARGGFPLSVAEALISDPGAIKLTAAEWVDFFRLNPTGGVYRALAGTVVARETLDREVDRILEGFPDRVGDGGWLATVWLALESGRGEAPKWVREELFRKPRAVSILDEFIIAHFSPPDFKDAHGRVDSPRLREWFLAQDSSRWVFDPLTKKYQLR